MNKEIIITHNTQLCCRCKLVGRTATFGKETHIVIFKINQRRGIEIED